MVSVMLKLVEYFLGILFLTSNRLEALDPAFQTRITLLLCHPDLNVTAREQVWIIMRKSGLDNTCFETSALAQQALLLNGQ